MCLNKWENVTDKCQRQNTSGGCFWNDSSFCYCFTVKKKENSASIFRTCQSLNIKNRWKFWSSNTIFSVMERVATVGCEWKQNAWIWFMLLLTKPCGRVKSVFAYRFLYSLNLVHRRSSDKRLFVLIFSSLYNHSARKLSRN